MKCQRLRVSAYALLHQSNQILLCRLSKEVPRWEGLWTLPGGGLNFGESPEDAVVREVEEETGLRIEVRSVARIHSIFDVSSTDEFHGIRIIYRAEVIGGGLRSELSGSTDLCHWHRLHPGPEVSLVDLAEVGVRVAQETWPSPSQLQSKPG
jgi:8-oxo-dGTP diphosphatase